MNPLVSICIPAFNQRRFIEETLRSCASQTYTPLEVIVLDNCSNDDTYDIARTFAQDQSNLHGKIKFSVYKNDKNIGAAGNFNRVIGMAKGEYIKLLCADDLIDPDCIAEQARCLDEHPDVALVTCDRRVINDKSEILLLPKVMAPTTGLSYETGINMLWRAGTNIFGEPLCVLFRHKDFLKSSGFSDKLPYVLDLTLYLQLWRQGKSVRIPRHLASFRIHEHSITSQSKLEQFTQYVAFMNTNGNPVPLLTKAIGIFRSFLRFLLRQLVLHRQGQRLLLCLRKLTIPS